MAEIIQYIQTAIAGKNFSSSDIAKIIQIITTGGASPAQIASLLTSLSVRGETVEEILSAVKTLYAESAHVVAPEGTIDVCKISKKAEYTLNIFTATALILAGCGVPVAKYGNSRQNYVGSANILSSLGVNINAGAKTAELALKEANICFMNSAQFHPGIREALNTSLELEIGTVLNVVIPLSNPANPRYRLVGITSPNLAESVADVLNKLGCKRAWIIHGSGGMSKLSIMGDSDVWELNAGAIKYFKVVLSDLGMEAGNKKEIQGGDLIYNVQRLNELMRGKRDSYRNIAILNAAAGLVVAGVTDNLPEGIAMAANSIDSGKAKQALSQLVEITN